jgi:hypothetical protein
MSALVGVPLIFIRPLVRQQRMNDSFELKNKTPLSFLDFVRE